MLEYFYIHYNLEIHMNNCIRNIKRVYTKLDKYLENPTKENIHDMRTSLRRLQATYQSSPREIRSKKMIKSFSKTGKNLFKINGEIRDIDIILEKLTRDGKMTEEQLEFFENSLTQERERRLVDAREVALELQNIKVPNTYDKSKTNQKLERKFRKKVAKAVSKLKTDIEVKTPVVIADDSKVIELHEVRKDTKKLRYLIELVLPKDDDASDKGIDKNEDDRFHNNTGYKILEHLEKLQKMLGDIHDYDMVINYLNQNESKATSILNALDNIKKIRKMKFKEFSDYTKPMTVITNNTK